MRASCGIAVTAVSFVAGVVAGPSALPSASLFGLPDAETLDSSHRYLNNMHSMTFEMACDELRYIFDNQCSCGQFLQSRSDLIECRVHNMHAVAHFGEQVEDTQVLESLQVCQSQPGSDQEACTTIHYGLLTPVSSGAGSASSYCHVTYGGPDRYCQSCKLCSSHSHMGTHTPLLGLDIECDNLNEELTTDECVAATELLGLSGAGRMGALLSIGLAIAITLGLY